MRQEPLSRTRTVDMRRGARIGIYEPTRLRPNDWSSIEIQVLDISTLGLRAECEARLVRASSISVDIPGVGAVEAEVIWVRDGEFGAAFIRPIDLASCSWTPGSAQAMLARMLVHRAAAQRDGRLDQERRLSRQIVSFLPLRALS